MKRKNERMVPGRSRRRKKRVARRRMRSGRSMLKRMTGGLRIKENTDMTMRVYTEYARM